MVRLPNILNFTFTGTTRLVPEVIVCGTFKIHSPPGAGLMVMVASLSSTVGGIRLFVQLAATSQLPLPLKV